MRRSFGRHAVLLRLKLIWHRSRFCQRRQRSRPRALATAAGRSERGIAQGRRRGLVIAAAVLACVSAGVGCGSIAWGPLPLDRANDLSVTVLDRNDRLLRAYTASDGRWRLPVAAADVDRRYLAMLIAFEDKRFRAHYGVDIWAIGRAGWQLLRHARIVSGGSTLSMQVVRLLLGEHQRTASGKLRQALGALALERRLSKQEIIGLYLRLAPFGGNLEGVRAAALAYLGKEPGRLS